MSFLSKGNIISTSLNLDNVEDFLFYDLKNVKNFENDNLKVEKYNVFLKNEKNNQYNVKK